MRLRPSCTVEKLFSTRVHCAYTRDRAGNLCFTRVNILPRSPVPALHKPHLFDPDKHSLKGTTASDGVERAAIRNKFSPKSLRFLLGDGTLETAIPRCLETQKVSSFVCFEFRELRGLWDLTKFRIRVS